MNEQAQLTPRRPSVAFFSCRHFLVAILVSALVGACASAPKSAIDPAQIAREAEARKSAAALNLKLTEQTSLFSAMGASSMAHDYRIGPGDELEIEVFRVEELSQTARVSTNGSILLPLLGRVNAAGKTVTELETFLAEELGREYIQNPQVSVFIAKYRASEVVVGGAVANPAVYSVTRPHTLLEMLLLAGGVSPAAGYKVNLHTTAADPETGEMRPVNLLVDLRAVMQDFELNQRLVLRGGDSVFVQRAGFVFVEGAVKSPGAKKIEGEVNVLKSLAMAGGVSITVDGNDIKVFREGPNGSEVFEFKLKDLQRDRSTDLVLQDGDLVVVGEQALKAAFYGFWRVFGGIIAISAI